MQVSPDGQESFGPLEALMDRVNFAPGWIEDPRHWIMDSEDEEAGFLVKPEGVQPQVEQPCECGKPGDRHEHQQRDSLDEEVQGDRRL
jgi:hypothetical protein